MIFLLFFSSLLPMVAIRKNSLSFPIHRYRAQGYVLLDVIYSSLVRAQSVIPYSGGAALGSHYCRNCVPLYIVSGLRS
jgi:hypothetical protein